MRLINTKAIQFRELLGTNSTATFLLYFGNLLTLRRRKPYKMSNLLSRDRMDGPQVLCGYNHRDFKVAHFS